MSAETEDDANVGKCTVMQLLDIITEPSDGFMMMPSRAMDEVYPNLFIGDSTSAKSINRLQMVGITHVLNTAQGTTRWHVNTGVEFYQDADIKYLGICAMDAADYNLRQHWEETSDFIEEALQNGGKVLVHCREGCSRSATITLAFLMLKRHLGIKEALTMVRRHREICPNDGFLQLLCDLNDHLLKAGSLKEGGDTERAGGEGGPDTAGAGASTTPEIKDASESTTSL